MKTSRKFYTVVFVLSVIQLIAACKVSKDISVPDTGLPSTFRDYRSGDSSIANIPWKSFIADTDLTVLIGNALIHNNDLLVAVKNIEAAGLTLNQAKLGNLPEVGMQAGATSSRPSDNSLDGLSLNQYLQSRHVEDYTLSASLSWEADIWGKIRSRQASVLAAYLQTSEVRKTVQTRIVSDVAKGYYNLLMLDDQLKIAGRNVQLNDSTLQIIELQYNAGQVTSLAVQQANSQKLSAAGLVPQFEQQIAVQENALSILCGTLPAAVIRHNDLESVRFADNLGAGIPSDILSYRPDVKSAELALTKANADVGYAKAYLYPSLTITAQSGLDAFKASNWFTIPASLFGAVAGSITQPLFQHKKLKTQYLLAKNQRDQTVISFRQSVLIAIEEVSDALVKIDKIKGQQAIAAERTATLITATDNAQLLFKNGMATYLEVLIAQGNVLQSELELATIKKQKLDATIDLYRSVGGGSN
jgi:multidrug efflux system outer membrane protein